jgi:DNA-binding MarR family transcriptional regulator
MTRWLDEDELRAWLRLAGVMLKLSPALDSQLQRDSDLTHFDYLCLAMLSESEGRTLRMSELAQRTNATLSRLSHVVSKLESRGWVARTPSPHSRRVTLVSLTDEGWRVLVKAAPGHVETVHSLVFEGLSPDDVAALERVAGHIVARIDASQLRTTTRDSLA